MRSVSLLAALALTLILANVPNTAAQSVDLPPAAAMPKVQAKGHAPPASRWQPPLTVQPIELAMPAVPAAAMPASPLPAVAIPRASVISACDASGYWINNGVRLQRSGPNLVGPHGPCTPQGTIQLPGIILVCHRSRL